ncbi:hypothetical protein SAMN05720470_10111 [Fibrobacter sp. UWOV1]|uniref:hypothetical protein n=1 Tax=Fibrobacter sp. UWOV1 TaxID=1896215 RepID=UPI000919079E|nr:hypothetical protein [Fibrobacter sp. UWOV1]SHK27339.1 hypothetical protein SAMN05720470_10111 [Fibrobacter sp. UWOV1]
MGYTNYWTSKTSSPKPEILTAEFRADLMKLVETANKNGIKCRYSDDHYCVTVADEENRCESFYLNTEEGNYYGMGFTWFDFCKTNALPFDAVVKCAIEIAVKHGIFEDDWSFDGDWSDKEYVKAVDLAKKADVGIYGAMAGRML